MSKLKSRIFLPVVILSAAAALGFGAVMSLVQSDVICRGVTVNGLKVGGLTREQAISRISEASTNRLLQTVSLSAAGRRWTGQLRELGVRVDAVKAADEAYKIGREGNFLERAWTCLAAPKTDIPLKYLVDYKKFGSTLEKIAKAVEVPHKDAKLQRVGNDFIIKPEQIGIKLDRKETIRLFKETVQKGNPTLNVKLTMDMPDVTAVDLAKIDTVLASFNTYFPAWRKDRTHNIRMAAAKVDGTVIQPNEIFSYNDVVGPRLRSLGYRDAPIFVKGKLVPGTGGGICQLSSTIYNAALLANMKIVERSNHSSTVPYVPAGRDATVAYGLLDFKFRNTTSAPIYIASRLSGSRLYVDIFGAREYKKDVDIQVVNNGPLRATVYRIIKQNGKEVSRELISRDRYRPAEPVAVVPKPKKRAVASSKPVIRAEAVKHSGSGSIRQASTSQ